MGQGQTSEVFHFGTFQADLRTGELRKSGARVRLQDQPFKILAALLQQPGELVTREQLRRRIWSEDNFGDFDHAIDLAVGKLRSALGDSAGTPRFVETLPRKGYRFIAPVASETTRQPDTKASISSSSEGKERVSEKISTRGRAAFKKVLKVGVLLAACSLAALLFLSFSFSEHSLPPQPRTVLVAHFDNRTGNPALDNTLEYVLQRDLTNSDFLKIVSPEQVEETLRLMKRPGNTPLDAELAREVCLRDGSIQQLIEGRVDRVGKTYVLTASIVDPASGRVLKSVTEEADGDDAILPALRRLSLQARRAAGESPVQIEASRANLEKVTTPSLSALKLYTDGIQYVNEQEWDRAAMLLQEAVRADPDFASAHVYLAHSLGNMGKEGADFHFKRAFDLADTTTDRERYFILGSYYQSRGEVAKAIEAYEVLERLYPDHFWGEIGLQYAYQQMGMEDRALAQSIERAQLRPEDFLANFSAWEVLENRKHDPIAARPYGEAAQKLVTPAIQKQFPGRAATATLLTATWFTRDGDAAHALAEADRLAGMIETLPHGEYRQLLIEEIGNIYLDFGKLKSVERLTAENENEGDRQGALEGVAQARGDELGYRKHLLEQFASGQELGPGTASRLAQEGFLKEARAVLAKLEHTQRPEMWLEHARGEVELASGHTVVGITRLQSALKLYNKTQDPHRFMTASALAREYEKSGNTLAAISILESELQSQVIGTDAQGSDPDSSFQLWKLYRKTGQTEKAAALQSGLLRWFAYADPDHVIVRELKSAQEQTASLQKH
jgi:DNA-binding winged helix-turn-helix (wHTH) protein/tetratricopeptide (TPR) repeat protein